MFKGTNSINFKSSKPREEVFREIEDQLMQIGGASISDRGMFTINASRYNGFSHDSEITGTVRERDGKYSIQLDWEAKPKWALVIIAAICTSGLGLLLLLFPYMASTDMQKKINTVMENLRFDFKE